MLVLIIISFVFIVLSPAHVSVIIFVISFNRFILNFTFDTKNVNSTVLIIVETLLLDIYLFILSFCHDLLFLFISSDKSHFFLIFVR